MAEDKKIAKTNTDVLPKNETHVFEMPHIENGVTEIGDLWDDSNSKPAYHNLLEISKFPSKILKACPINKCSMKFKQIRSNEDKIDSLHLDGKMSLEFMLGRIKLEGQSEYDSETSSKRSVNCILYNYLNEQYKVQLMPRIKPELLNRGVEKMLQSGTIGATHIVGGIIIGAEVTAWIEVTDTSSDKNVQKDAQGTAQCTAGVVKVLSSLSGSASLHVNKSDSTNINNNEVKLSVTARPAVEQSPTSLDEFLPFIRNLSKDLTKHSHFPDVDSKIFGVPIRFILYPVSHYVDMETMKLYRELTDASHKDFIGVIAKCNDLKQTECIRKTVLARNHNLKFLLDSKSEFSKKVASYEKEITELAQDFLRRSCKALSHYKSCESEIVEIENIVHEFYRSEICSAQERANHMADEGTKELQRAYFDPADEDLQSRVKRFTDRNECEIWLGKAKPRLLLEIKPPCSEAIVKSFLDAVQHLIKLEVDAAIAMPSISESVCLILKCNDRKEHLEGPLLSKALDVLNATVVEGNSSIHTFYKILGSFCSIKLPLCQDDTSSLDKVLVTLLKETSCQGRAREVCFVRSVCDFATELNVSPDRMVICLPVGAPDTDLEVVKQFRSLARKNEFSNVKWIFCDFRVINYNEAPLLLIFAQSELVAVCLDNLDILILIGLMNSKSDRSTANFDYLSLTPARFTNTLYPERARYTLEIMGLINSDTKLSRSKISGVSDESHEDCIKHLVMVIRATLHNASVEMASAVAALVTESFPGLSNTLKNYGWCEGKQSFDTAQFEKEDYAANDLVIELEKWMNNHSLAATVQEVQKQLIDLQTGLAVDTDRTFTAGLSRIMNDDHCPRILKTQLSKVKASRQSLKAKCSQLSDILNIDTLKEALEAGCGHVKALVIVLKKYRQKELVPETIGEELAYVYSSRSTTVTGNPMVENKIKRYLRPYQPYYMLNTLLPVKHQEPLMFLYEALENLENLDNSKAVAEIIGTVCGELNQANNVVLWKNEQWLFLVRHCINSHNNEELIYSLSKLMTKTPEIDLIPADIVKILARKEVTSVSRITEFVADIIEHEYSFQAYGEMYHIALGENLRRDYLEEKLLQRFAEILITGKAVELVNGDSCEIPLAFFRSICRAVSLIRTDMRVFVITLFELHMSKKSSLLSALFSCKFAASVERHNARSLFMKMILLDDSVRKVYGYDAIIVLNTERLGSQEAITSYSKGSYYISRDWLLTIFAISLSNLTIIDEVIFDGQTKEFELVIEVIARLRQVGITPDLLISRLLRHRASLTEATGENIDKVIRTVLGAVASKGDAYAACSNQLKNRLYNGDLYLDVSTVSESRTDEIPYTCETLHEDVTNLYQSLLSRVESREHKITFEYWSELLHSSWACLKERHSYWLFKERNAYWLCLREALSFFELAYFGKKFATVKELLHRTFFIHRETLLKDEKERHISAICQQLETIPSHCPSNCRSCQELVSHREKLYLDVKDTAWQDIIRISIQKHRKSVFDSIKTLLEMDCQELLNRQSIGQNVSKQITDELKKIQKEHPDGIFNDAETDIYVKEIWQRLLTIFTPAEHELSEKELFAQIVDELFPKQEDSGLAYYSLMADFKSGQSVDATEFEEADSNPKSVAEDESLPLTVPKMIQIIAQCEIGERLLHSQTKVLHRVSLNNLHIFKLSNEIDHVISKFLTARKFDYLQAGIKFENVMVNDFNDHIVDIISRFEAEFKLSLPEKMRRLLQIYFLKTFFDRLMILQKKWNLSNVAINLLSQKKSHYKEYISTRLACGFSSEAEGKLAAKYLIIVIRQRAIKDGQDAKVSSVLRIPWIANSETVRLRYFETLALDVAAGEKETALEHFRNPQTSITKWYKDTVNNDQSKDAQKAYCSTLSKGLRRVIQEVRACKDFNELDLLLRRYETCSSSIFKYERFETEGDEFGPMLKSLEKELNIALDSSSDDFEMLPDIWENSEVRLRLGCTEECFLCGALCWNYSGHTDDESELSKHYACHQARGMAKASAGHNKEILASPCSQISEQDMVTLPGCCGDSSTSLSRKEIDNNHLGDWKFQKYVISKHDELMRWFFQELHIDLAREKKLKCPNEATLKKWGCWGLKLPNILATLRSEIN